MSYKNWSSREMFLLFQYPEISKKELSKKLDRSLASIQAKIQELNISKDYDKSNEKYTLKQFCSDCAYNPKTCKMNPVDCLEDSSAELYLKYYNIIHENKEKVSIKIKKRKKCKKPRLIG